MEESEFVFLRPHKVLLVCVCVCVFVCVHLVQGALICRPELVLLCVCVCVCGWADERLCKCLYTYMHTYIHKYIREYMHA